MAPVGRRGPPYDDEMADKTTRRGILGAGAAALAALAAWSATAWLRGDKARANMQTETTTKTPARAVERVLTSDSAHWVGDGFLVRSIIHPGGDPAVQSPFLLLDHAAPRRFAPASEKRGVGEHPHRGFETVTFAYRGEVDHRDSAGGGGRIGPGDVQWMTAGSGLVHEEFHSQRFTEQGGDFEMVQLWVNLPARAKMTKPGYQPLLDAQFPRVQLGAAKARVVAGSLNGHKGPAHTHTPITVFDLEFGDDGSAAFELPRGFTSLLLTLEGEIQVGAEERRVTPGQMAVLDRDGTGQVELRGKKGARMLVLSGEPIDEPVAAYGPFVMNTREEIMQAMRDYQSGKMGHLPR
jgi:redox-sensitive bicupin YhaK (pirin superfamily)